MSNEMYRADIVFDVNDTNILKRLADVERRIAGVTNRVKKGNATMAADAVKSSNEVARTSAKVVKSIDNIDKRAIKISRKKFMPVIDVKDEATKKADRVDQTLKRIARTKYITAVRLGGQSEVMKGISDIKSKLDDMGRRTSKPKITVDPTRSERVMERIRSGMKGLNNLTAKVVIKATDMTGGLLKSIGKGTLGTAAVGSAASAAGGIYALNLAAQKENSLLGMEFFTGSKEKGLAAYAELEEFAAVTPYEMPFVREQAVGLMGMYKGMQGRNNFDEKKMREDTLRTLRAFGDAAGLTGAGENGATLALLGFRQIGTIGKLNMEELRQVTENLLVPMDMIREEMGLTGEQMQNIGKKGIPAAKAMDAILRALEKNFGGGMEKMSQTYDGMFSTLRDTARIATTEFGAGMANPLKDMMRDLIKETDYTEAGFKRFASGLKDMGAGIGNVIRDTYFNVKDYMTAIFDDPEYKKLTTPQAKVKFVFNEMMDDFKAWWGTEGRESTKNIAKEITDVIALGLKESQPLVDAGIKIGVALGEGILQGIYENDVLKYIFGGLLAGHITKMAMDKGLGDGKDAKGNSKGGGGGGVVVPGGEKPESSKKAPPKNKKAPRGFGGFWGAVSFLTAADYAMEKANDAGDWIFGHSPGQPKNKMDVFGNPFAEMETYKDYRPGIIKRTFFPDKSNSGGMSPEQGIAAYDNLLRAGMYGEPVKPATKDDVFNVMTGLNLPKLGDPVFVDSGQVSSIVTAIRSSGSEVRSAIASIPQPTINIPAAAAPYMQPTPFTPPKIPVKNPANPIEQLQNFRSMMPQKYANGGIARRPHLGIVAEAGYAESMIPHDPSKRTRAIGLLNQTADAFGIGRYEESTSPGGQYKAQTAFSSVGSGNGISVGQLIGEVNVDASNDLYAQVREISDMVAIELLRVIQNTE